MFSPTVSAGIITAVIIILIPVPYLGYRLYVRNVKHKPEAKAPRLRKLLLEPVHDRPPAVSFQANPVLRSMEELDRAHRDQPFHETRLMGVHSCRRDSVRYSVDRPLSVHFDRRSSIRYSVDLEAQSMRESSSKRTSISSMRSASHSQLLPARPSSPVLSSIDGEAHIDAETPTNSDSPEFISETSTNSSNLSKELSTLILPPVAHLRFAVAAGQPRNHKLDMYRSSTMVSMYAPTIEVEFEKAEFGDVMSYITNQEGRV